MDETHKVIKIVAYIICWNLRVIEQRPETERQQFLTWMPDGIQNETKKENKNIRHVKGPNLLVKQLNR